MKKLGGRGARRKGHAFERWVAKKLRGVFPGAKRHLEYQADEALGVDIDGSGVYKIQCKRGRRYAPLSAIDEVQLCPIEGGIKILVTKGDNTEPLAALPFEHFLHLLKNQKGVQK